MAEYDCGKCLPSDCRGSPAYFDPECPIHGAGRKPTLDETVKAIEFFEKLKRWLDTIDYDPLSPERREIHLAAKHGNVLSKMLKLVDSRFTHQRR